MDQTDVAAVSAALGLRQVDSPRRLRSGLGGTELWQFGSDRGPMVLRVFAAGTAPAVVEREVLAHRFASDHGIAAPTILTYRLTGERPVVLMEWIGGGTVAERLWADGDSAYDLGRQCGVALQELHSLDAANLTEPPIGCRSWIEWAGNDWAGEDSDALIDQLRRFDGDRLLHLDFHPENLIITEDGTLYLLDWANVRRGPPAADLARTLSILELIDEAVPDLTDRHRAVIGDYRSGLLAGYAASGGDPEIPAIVQAWAYAVQLDDLAGSWVPAGYLDQLRSKIDFIVARA